MAVAGVGFLGGVILVLSLASTEYSPITQVASDYGVGAYAPEMNAGFFLAGVGVVSLAVGILLSDRSRAGRVGAGWLLAAGLALLTNAFFQTDIEGAASTVHGTIHGLAGVVFFVASPVGVLLYSRGAGGRRFLLTFAAFVAGYAFVVMGAATRLDINGLSERIVILVVFVSLVLTAARVYSEA